ncbi:lipase 3-like [Daktulosphaira vitifoliae]|uniref:lipase 3-like n=1 Tax=Daktulosphaira vitifoliae TaxID=58002 RepID=UPI0021A9F612|nr:lipase 3-like [Daktulosphaira vitifoliae]
MTLFPKFIYYFSISFLNTLELYKCTYIPDASLSVPKIIKRHGYASEAHIINTEDGYLLEVHRIPNNNNIRKYPIYLQHGVLASSADWVISGPKNSLAYQLSDQGFDVWLGNSRGNTYSRSHVSIDPENEKFWNYSFHEIGYYDLPATIDYILNYTNQSQLIYIGHSMGTCVFFVMCSTLPEYNDKIRMQVSLAPIAYVKNMKSMLFSLVPYADQINKVASWISNGAFLPQNTVSKLVNKYLCGENAATEAMLCKKYLVYKLFGDDPVQFNASLLPVILAHNPAGSSAKTLMHFAQEIISGNFQQYDYGIENNIIIYNCTHPPIYNLSNVIAPTYFYYSKNDYLSDPKDVMELYTRLPHRLGIHLINYEKFNHIDFMYSRNVNGLLNKYVIDSIIQADKPYWIPLYDKDTIYNITDQYFKCKNKDHFKVEQRQKDESIWEKITSFLKQKSQFHPIIKTKIDEQKQNTNHYSSWKQSFNE